MGTRRVRTQHKAHRLGCPTALGEGYAGPVGGGQGLDTGQPSLIRMSRAVRAGVVEGAVRAMRAERAKSR